MVQDCSSLLVVAFGLPGQEACWLRGACTSLKALLACAERLISLYFSVGILMINLTQALGEMAIMFPLS